MRLLVGQTVESVDMNDGLFVRMKSGSSLDVVNASEIFCEGRPVESERLIGVEIYDLEYDGEWLYVHLSNNCQIKIDMRDEAFKEPEALRVRTSDGQILIWN